MKRLGSTNRVQKRSVLFVVLVHFLLLQFSLRIASADIPTVTVQEILNLPESYQLHVVTLHGKVDNVLKFDHWTKRGYCINSHAFTLTDGTGSIQVLIRGICAPPLSPLILIPLPTLVNEGEVVFVEGQVQADPSQLSQPPNLGIIVTDQGVRVNASKIWR